ncbi:Hypothetical protein A7982_08397 [Minicystis rosea]|nr:Hypothetical protein A7982_08397 [Minicystis rosea]
MARLHRLRHVIAVLASAGAISCGASIQALYEGDVRFERCMALDARPDVKPTIRRGCWEEWAQFYTFGQTRDRIEYAQLREKQLSTASDFDEADWVSPNAGRAIAAPDPTSAFAPPPTIVAVGDAGPPDAGSSDDHTPQNACAADCQHSLDACRGTCKTAPCEKACSGRYKRCAKRCGN